MSFGWCRSEHMFEFAWTNDKQILRPDKDGDGINHQQATEHKLKRGRKNADKDSQCVECRMKSASADKATKPLLMKLQK